LGQQVTEAEQAGADRSHVDVMAGHFVPNLSMGSPIVASLRSTTQLPLETQLMISDPDSFLDEFAQAGSDSLLVRWDLLAERPGMLPRLFGGSWSTLDLFPQIANMSPGCR
jgi:ribulose-phosphate 3-epimerase